MLKLWVLWLITCFALSPSKSVAQSWERCSTGLPDTSIFSLTRVGSVLYAGTQGGTVYRSSDGGDSWQITGSVNGLSRSQTWSMASIDTFVFAGQRGGGIFRSSLNVDSWKALNTGLTNKIIQDLEVCNGVLYAATLGGGVFASADTGLTWRSLTTGLDDLVIFSLASNSTTVFAGSAGSNTGVDTGVAFRMTPDNKGGGTPWLLINAGLLRNGAHLEGSMSLDANDTVVYLGTDDLGLFRSTNSGDLWTQVSSLPGDVHSIRIAGQSVYYGTTYSGIYRSDDGGMTFTTNNEGLKYGNKTLPYLVKDLLVFGDKMFAATDIGVFRQTIPEAPLDVKNARSQNNSYASPNPFSVETKLHLKVPNEGPLKISVIDMIGRTVEELASEHLESGSCEVRFRPNGLSPGQYFCLVESDGRLQIIPLLLLR